MGKAIEYRQYAKECRRLAETFAKDEVRERLLDVAEAWEKLAAENDQRFNATDITPLQRAAARVLLARIHPK